MQEVLELIRQSKNPVVFGHVNPNPDSIASSMVTAWALGKLGKNVSLVLPRETVGRKYLFMLDMKEFSAQQSEPDLVVVVDTAMRKRINKPKELELPNVAICNIDHHLGNEKFGAANWIDVSAASTSQMIYLLVKELKLELTADEATLLYAGIHSDTIGFSLASTDHAALMIAAELAKAGAKIGWVCQRLHRSLTPIEFQLLKIIYDHTCVTPCGRFAYSTVTLDEMSKIGATPNDIDEQVAVPRSIDGIKIAALLTESKPNAVRINLRAEDTINILPLARMLGGGGHAQAAGAVVKAPFDEVVENVKRMAIEFLNGLSAHD